MKKSRIALFNIFVVAFNVQVTAAALCSTVEDVRRDVSFWKPPPSVVELDQETTAAFLDRYNKIPPVSNLTAHHSVVISVPNNPVVVYVTFDKDCALMTYTMPRAFFINLMVRTKTEGISL